jgi:hypothetical protein
MSFVIVRAEASQAEELSEIAYAAKAFWNYPESWLKLWCERGDLRRLLKKIQPLLPFMSTVALGFTHLFCKQIKPS